MSAADAPEESRSEPAREPDAEDLLDGVAGGDRGAVMALYDRFAPALMAVALRVTGSRAEAEDVLQDVFARVWREAVTNPDRLACRRRLMREFQDVGAYSQALLGIQCTGTC
jgi:hypothetical protein